MRWTFALPALLLAAGAAVAQTPATRPVVMPGAEEFDLTSATGKPYRITIATPREPAPAAGYAVLYVLDANAFYATAVEAVRFQQKNVPCVVVGVNYPSERLDMARRYWDFTPPTSAEHIAIRKLNRGTEGFVEPSGTGGQGEFFAFLQDTLRPAVNAKFKTDPARQCLFGHSLSARFTLHVLATRPDAFSYYLAASPSVWWDAESLKPEIADYLKRPDAPKPAGVMITVGEYEQAVPPGTPPDRVAFLNAAKMVDNARQTADTLKAAGIDTVFVEWPGENHGSGLPMAISRGVRFALRTIPPTTAPAR